MPGMTGGQGASDVTLETAFKSALLAQGTLAFLIFVLLAIAWVACREVLLARARSGLVARLAAARAARQPEPAARRFVRISFGVLWIFDGLLQAQPTMPGGLPAQVIEPAAHGSPGWVQHLVSWAATVWSAHPVQAAAAAVWIQLGLGIWLLATASPRWSRFAAVVSAGWGLVVWMFGEALGGLLAPGLSWLTGAPGGVLFYCAAGLLLALPFETWRGARLGRRILQAEGALMIVFAVLQAWPGRGFWQGRLGGRPGSLTAAIRGMAAAHQPAALHTLLDAAAGVVARHGFAVNLLAVTALAVTGAGLLAGRPALARLAAFAAIGLCLADWVLVQDFGFLGGIGTDPNSMLPQALLLGAGMLALRPGRGAVTAPATAAAPAPAPLTTAPLTTAPLTTAPLTTGTPAAGHCGAAGPAARRLRPGAAIRSLGVAVGSASTGTVLAVWAAAIVVLGAAPMAAAAASGATPGVAAAHTTGAQDTGRAAPTAQVPVTAPDAAKRTGTGTVLLRARSY